MEALIKQPAMGTVTKALDILSYGIRAGDWLVLLFLIGVSLFYVGDGNLWGKPDPNAYLMYVAPQKSGELKVRPRKTRDVGQRLEETVSNPPLFVTFATQRHVLT
jgi:hypothetical protein